MAGLKDGMGCTKLPARFLPIQRTGHILSTFFADEYVNMYAVKTVTLQSFFNTKNLYDSNDFFILYIQRIGKKHHPIYNPYFTMFKDVTNSLSNIFLEIFPHVM